MAAAAVCLGMLTFVTLFALKDCDVRVSQISPKSAEYAPHEQVRASSIQKTDIRATSSPHAHELKKRSANPILKDKRSLNDGLRILDDNAVDASVRRDPAALRNLEGHSSSKSRAFVFPERPEDQSESNGRSAASQERQNNPDIKDIITGIVKLLNGNVNVQANTQPALYRPPRPYNTRINNRGPPRISETQSLPPQPTRIPPPYPFYRPDSSMHPFINGIPVPERIVPPFISTQRLPSHPIRRPTVPLTPITEAHTTSSTEAPITQKITDEVTPEKSEVAIDVPPPTQEVWDAVNTSSNSMQSSASQTENIQTEPSTENAITEKPSTTTTESPIAQEPITPSSTSAPTEPAPIQELDSSTEIITIESSIQEKSSSTILSSHTATPSIPSIPQISTIATTIKPVVVTSSEEPLPFTNFPYAKPGIVLDDPEFKPGVKKPTVQSVITATRPLHPAGYGEIFDVTVSAIQGPGSEGVKPVDVYPEDVDVETVELGSSGNRDDIIVSPFGDQGFVSIDGKRTYLNLFGESAATKTTTQIIQSTPVINQTTAHAGVAEPAPIPPKPVAKPIHIPSRRPSPPVRIDTCIVGDDSTCDQSQNERCRTEIGVSSCHCRPGYTRRKHRESCRKMVSLMLSLRVDRLYEKHITWDPDYSDPVSEPRRKMSYEAIRAISSAMSMTPFSDDYLDAKVNKIFKGDDATGGVWVNMTMNLNENLDTMRPNTRGEIQRHLLGVIHRRNNNVGNSAVYVDSPVGAVAHVQDLDECADADLNDCHPLAKCSNIWGGFRCECPAGLKDPWREQTNRAGRQCEKCPEEYCNNRGECRYEESAQICSCTGNYYGTQCEIDGEVLGVAVGASVAAVIIIGLTLGFLVMWSRRWNREQKSNTVCSPVFGYMTAANTGVKMQPGNGTHPTYLTAEDRMRWAQIADVMAQSNLYAAEPVAAPRPSSAMYGYPTMGSISMAATLPVHQRGIAPPVALPRLGIHMNRQSYPPPFDNSSSSEEEDRTDLLGRGGFQIARPRSRSSGSLVNLGASQSIYSDVDYEPSRSDLYPGLPMSTYSLSARPPFYR